MGGEKKEIAFETFSGLCISNETFVLTFMSLARVIIKVSLPSSFLLSVVLVAFMTDKNIGTTP